jgi:Lon protease-like protein
MEIPLFPLPSLVLFPNIAVPLHIFEERYKLMINGCIDTGEAFGLVLLRSGATEESDETIHRVGVAARISDVERLDDGRMNIMCEGEGRFRISRFTQQTPFWKGSVQFFEEEPESESFDSLYEQVAAQYRQLAALSSELNETVPTELTLTDSATDLSFMLAYILDIDSEEKQKMLEMTSTSERLQVLVLHLTETITDFEKQIKIKKIQTKARGNGDLGKPGKEK